MRKAGSTGINVHNFISITVSISSCSALSTVAVVIAVNGLSKMFDNTKHRAASYYQIFTFYFIQWNLLHFYLFFTIVTTSHSYSWSTLWLLWLLLLCTQDNTTFNINRFKFHDVLFSPISQHSVWSELTCHNSLHWTVTKRGHSSQFGRLLQCHGTARTTKSNFLWSAKTQYQKTHKRPLPRLTVLQLVFPASYRTGCSPSWMPPPVWFTQRGGQNA